MKQDSRSKEAHRTRVPGSFHFSGSNTGYCALPISGDTYRNCAHQCVYCYERQTPNQHLKAQVKVHPRDHKTLLASIYEDPQIREFIVDRGVPVRIGALSDPFPPMEAWFRNTERLLKLLGRLHVPVQMTTKNPLGVDDGHIVALQSTPHRMVRVSFSTLNDERAKLLEPGAPPPSERLKAMRRIADAGIEVGARMSPFLHSLEENFSPATYQALYAAGARNVTFELVKFSATWRHTWEPTFWEVVSGDEAPAFDGPWRAQMSNKQSPVRKWAERMEKRFFAPLQNLKRHRYTSGGYNFILYDPFVLRKLFTRLRGLCHDAGLRFAMCSFSDGIHNIDLNDAPCGCLMESPGWPGDMGALVPAWHKNKWADYIVPAIMEYEANVAIDRFMIVHDATVRPLELEKVYPSGLVTAAESIPDAASSEVLNIKGGQRGWDPVHVAANPKKKGGVTK